MYDFLDELYALLNAGEQFTITDGLVQLKAIGASEVKHPTREIVLQVEANDVTGPARSVVLEIVEYPRLGKRQWHLKAESAHSFNERITQLLIEQDMLLLEPHLEAIRAAYPTAVVYHIRDHRLRSRSGDLIPNAPVIVAYTVNNTIVGPNLHGGFVVDGYHRITYAEAECWRYKEV